MGWDAQAERGHDETQFENAENFGRVSAAGKHRLSGIFCDLPRRTPQAIEQVAATSWGLVVHLVRKLIVIGVQYVHRTRLPTPPYCFLSGVNVGVMAVPMTTVPFACHRNVVRAEASSGDVGAPSSRLKSN